MSKTFQSKYYETNRLVLRILDESHASQVLDYCLRNRDFLKEWENLREDEYFTIPYHQDALNIDLQAIEEGRSLRLWLFKKEDTEFRRVIGNISLSNIVYGPFLSCHLGYRLDKEEINRGYITEALKKGIDIAFHEYKLHRIEANIMPKNLRSLRVVEKLGFQHEGLARNYLKINGKWEDHIHMVLLNNEV